MTTSVNEGVADAPGASPDGRRHMVELSREESLALLGGVPLGRIVFTEHALPAVRPVNHILDGDDVVVRTHAGAALAGAVGGGGVGTGVVVAYEADDIDLDAGVGWSVVVTGYARLVRDPAQVNRYVRLIRPWGGTRVMDCVVRITPDLVTGYRLVDEG